MPRPMPALLFAAIAAFLPASSAFAHPATEQYIPIGQSPGAGVVSGRAGVVAEPAAVGGPPMVSVENASGAELGDYVVTPRTRIYIDRSAQGLPNLLGAISDVQPGRVIEVRIGDPQTHAAEWIKVRP